MTLPGRNVISVVCKDAYLQEIDQQIPPVDFFHPYEPIGGNGESQLDLYTRASLALQRIIRQPAGSYLVVSHGGILNKALYVIMGITPQGHYNSPIFHFGNTGYAQFRYNSSSRQWAVISLNNQRFRCSAEGITILEARLNWLIFGAGAIGTYIGGNLILHGQKVVFLEQPEVDLPAS